MALFRPRIAHVIPSLDHGGAEQLLMRFVLATQDRFDHRIFTLKRHLSTIGEALLTAGIPVTSVGLDSPVEAFGALRRLNKILKTEAGGQNAADLVQGWLYHGNVAASLAAPYGLPVCHSIHATDYRLAPREIGLFVSIHLNRLLARKAAAIIYCTGGARSAHEAHGFPKGPGIVVRNGVDTDRFAPRLDQRHIMRAKLGLSADVPVVGYISRYTRFKDTGNFAQTLAILRQTHPNIVAVALGKGLGPDNGELKALLDAHGVTQAVHLLGPRDNIAELHAAFDLVMLSSSDSEALPLSIIEAMASGLPVAATSVGDLPELLAGLIVPVPPRDPKRLAALADSLLLLSEAERTLLGARLRARVEAEYGLPSVCEGFAQVYQHNMIPKTNKSMIKRKQT
ncbi:RfaG Glycosyltransferase [Rhabdaerophilaceae bacterium]